MDEKCRAIVGAVEAYCDGLADGEHVERAYRGVHHAKLGRTRLWAGVYELRSESAADAAIATSEAVVRTAIASGSQIKEFKYQSTLVGDIFGNPFRPVSADPSWLTSTVLSLAQGIYDDRAFDRLPILADALQDAGCDNPDILDHCRSDGPHVRGCWLVDLILAKQ